MKDLVCKYPDDIAIYFKKNGKLPDNFVIDGTDVCAINKKRYFVHAIAVLPIKAYVGGVGFGLWVEVSRDDFMKYIHLYSDDEYNKFKMTGVLANEWPGFLGMKGARVTIRAVKKNEKYYITEVLDINDPVFDIALRMSVDDTEGIDRIRKMVEVYVEDSQNDQFFWK